MHTPFTQAALAVIQAIPQGRVLTYGRVAALAGNPRAARQVSRLLHSMSRKYQLPWHRVINAQGRISLKPGQGLEEQQALLESEGIVVSVSGRIDLSQYLWEGREEDQIREMTS
ncbi:MAG: MGMT family protein [Desulfobacterales bacterium]|nr:MGMT family protein [Desulfobacterales bacterium]